MSNVTGGGREDLSLATGDILTVASVGHGVGYVSRYGDRPGDAGHGVTAVGDGESVTFGPFTAPARFEVTCTSGVLSFSAAPADSTAEDQIGGSVILSKVYGGADSYQPVAVDLDLEVGVGTSDAGDTSFLAPIMGNALGADLAETHNYLGGVIGADSITGAKAGELQKGAVIGIAMDGVTDADAPVVSVIDGDDPSSVTRTHAMFAARMNNNNAGSGADFGLDLYDVGRSSEILSGGGVALAYAKADLRLSSEVCAIVGAGIPVDGVSGTGAGIAGPGSLYIRTATVKLYINTGTKASPVWSVVGAQS